MMEKKQLKSFGVMLVILVILTAVVLVVIYHPPTTQYTPVIYDINNFSSYQAFTDYLNTASRSSGYYTSGGLFLRSDLAAPTMVGEMASNGKMSDSTGLLGYSETNVQVAGVDEPDIVKTDGTFLYIVSKNRVVIVRAYPAENASIETVITLDDNHSIQNLFLSGSRLVIFAQTYDSYPALYRYEASTIIEDGISIPPWQYSQYTYVGIYDLEIVDSPALVKEVVISGYFSHARLIESYAYIITTEYSYTFNNDQPIIPKIWIDGEPIDIPLTDIYYVDMPVHSNEMTNIVSINVHDDEEQIHQEIYLLGSAQTLYVSHDNIFVTCPNYYFYDYTVLQQLIEELIIPLLPATVKTQIDSVDTFDLDEYQRQEIRMWIIQKYIQDSMPEHQKNEIKKEIIRQTEQTIIHRISIDNGEITYEAQGSVPGYVNNQFSLDQYNGYLRVSTTIHGGSLWYLFGGGSINQEETNLYVLDMELRIVGSLEDITPDSGERIYATRFIGDLCYLVTFRQIDPFFVIDISTPTAPLILGELKIPGFSTYLHPYDDDYIIGVGRDERHVKISLFDVTDMTNPLEYANYTIENPDEQSWWWTESAALYEHKAFLFNKDRKLLVLPVGSYTQQNAYVFSIDVETGIDLRGVIVHDHETEEEQPYWWYGTSGNSIQRTLYINDILYTISTNMVKLHQLTTLDEIQSIVLV